MPSAAKRQIYLLHLTGFFTGTVFWYGIEKVFMQSIGFDALHIAINSAIMVTATVLFDVPSGILTDKWRRTYVLIIANFLSLASSLLLGISHEPVLYACGTILNGIYVVTYLTAYPSILYDTLKEHGQEHLYSKHAGMNAGLMMTGYALSSLAGGYIAHYAGLRAPFLWSILPAALNIGLLCLLREPAVHRTSKPKKILGHIRASTRIIVLSPSLRYLAGFLILATMLRLTTNEFNGLYYVALGFSAITIGYVNAGKWLASAFGRMIAHRVGQRRVFMLLPLFFICYALFSIISSWLGTVFYLLSFVAYGLAWNEAETSIQGKSPSELRTTTLSLITFVGNAIMIPLSIAFGWIAQYHSVFRAFQVFACIGIAFVAVWLARGYRIVRDAHLAQNAQPAVLIESVK